MKPRLRNLRQIVDAFKGLRSSLVGMRELVGDFVEYDRRLIGVALVTPYALGELRKHEADFVDHVLLPALELSARLGVDPDPVLDAVMSAARQKLADIERRANETQDTNRIL